MPKHKFSSVNQPATRGRGPARKLLPCRDQIIAAYKSGFETNRSLALRFGVSVGTVSTCLRQWLSAEDRREAQRLSFRLRRPESAAVWSCASQIVEAYRGGATFSELAAKYSCRRRLIQSIIDKSNLSAEERRSIKAGHTKRGERHPSWSGGKRVSVDGRQQVLVGGRYVGVHREVASRVLGRDLRDGEVVHHIYGDSGRNSASDLAVLSSGGIHTELHAWVYRRLGELCPELMLSLNREFLAGRGELPPLADMG